MMIDGFNGVKIGGNVKPRTVGEALNSKSETVGYIPGSVLEGYNKFIDDNFEGLEILKQYGKGADGTLTGTTPLMNSGLRMCLQKNHPDIELTVLSKFMKAVKNGLKTDNRFIDFAYVLNGLDGNNPYQARKIAEQTDSDLEFPVVYWIKYTKLELDKKAPEGVSVIIDSKKAFTATSLREQYMFDEIEDAENGMPVANNNGKRTSYPAGDDLCRSALDGGGGFYSGVDALADSNSFGGVAGEAKPE